MYYYNYAIIPKTIVSFLCIVYTLMILEATDNDLALKNTFSRSFLVALIFSIID